MNQDCYNLWVMQAKENDGRGISCIKGTCASLESGDIEGAKQGIRTDWDKIRNYPKIAKYLKQTIMKGEKFLGYTDENGKWND